MCNFDRNAQKYVLNLISIFPQFATVVATGVLLPVTSGLATLR
jgi:hypothetical protein